MSTCHVYSNRHISNQVANIKENDTIVLENALSKKRWSLYFKVNNINKNNLNINYINSEDFMSLQKIKFDAVVGNPPYNDSSVGRNPIWHKFVLSNVGNKSTSWVIPTSWMISETSTFNEVRKFILNSGLKKIKLNSKDTFESATVRTVTVFMEEGYNGLVEVEGKTTYFYDYKKNNILIDTGSAQGNDILFSLKEKTPLLGYTTKNNKDTVIAAETNNISDVKFLKKMTKAGNEYSYAPSDVFSYNKHDNDWRVVVGYRPSGLEMGDYRLGLTSIVEPGVKILHSPLIYIPVSSRSHGENLQRYLKTKIVEEFILKNTRTSPTLDIKQSTGQTKFLPMLLDGIDIHTEEDVYKFFQLSEKEIQIVKSSY